MGEPATESRKSTRQNLGVALLVLSVLYSAADLAGWMRPMLLRWRAHPGAKHFAALVLGSLTMKAVVLLSAMVLAFWPARRKTEEC
jgi:hypothetical protein